MRFGNETGVHFWSHFASIDPLLQCCVFAAFWNAHFLSFFEILSAPGSILGTILNHFLGPLAFEKSVESVQLSPFLEVLPLPNRVFLQTLTVDAF